MPTLSWRSDECALQSQRWYTQSSQNPHVRTRSKSSNNLAKRTWLNEAVCRRTPTLWTHNCSCSVALTSAISTSNAWIQTRRRMWPIAGPATSSGADKTTICRAPPLVYFSAKLRNLPVMGRLKTSSELNSVDIHQHLGHGNFQASPGSISALHSSL